MTEKNTTLESEIQAPTGQRYPTSQFRRKATEVEADALSRVYAAAGNPKNYLHGEQHVEVESKGGQHTFWILDLPPGHKIVPKRNH